MVGCLAGRLVKKKKNLENFWASKEYEKEN